MTFSAAVFTTATFLQCQKPTVLWPILFGDRTSLSLFMLCCSCFSQSSAHTCQIKSACINKGGRKWYLQFFRKANTNLPACTKSKHITDSFPCCCLTAQTIRDTLAALPDAAAAQKAKREATRHLRFTSKAQTFLLFSLKKKKLHSEIAPALTVALKNNKIPSVFSWASSPARQKDFRT